MQQASAVADSGMLTGARIGIVAEPTPEIEAIEWALFRAGAEVQMLPRGYPGWPGDGRHDVVIVRVSPPRSARASGTSTRRHDAALEALAAWQRVIALVDNLDDPAVRGVRDFVTAPFGAAEVLARIARVLREPVPEELLRAGNLELQVTNRQVTVDGQILSLTYNEFEILRALLAAGGGVISRESVARSTGSEEPTAVRSVDIHIHRLRAKLGAVRGVQIETVRRVGYRISSP